MCARGPHWQSQLLAPRWAVGSKKSSAWLVGVLYDWEEKPSMPSAREARGTERRGLRIGYDRMAHVPGHLNSDDTSSAA